ncbi:MAG TPA: DUF2726 domain-containing protein, partial [Crenotrichaceae bacterium]|nr:DUF2726 domain-containing protein [Crenotrichaceae bacterium]
MTSWLPWGILALVLLAVTGFFISNRDAPKTNTPAISKVKYRYRRRKSLCTMDELSFLQILEIAAGGSIRVFSKVHASQVLTPRSDLSIVNWNLSFEKLVSKSFDYVLCTADEMKILCVVMLETQKSIKKPSHNFILKACRAVQLPVIILAAEKEYSPKQIRYLLKKKIPDAFPRPENQEVPSIIREYQEKIKLTRNSKQDSLQMMLLKEGRRRVTRLKQK